MEEYGVVVKAKGSTVLIKAARTSACDGCSSKKSCSSGGAGNNEMLIEATNEIGAKAGDHVVFTVGAGSVLKAGLLLYLVPIVSFITGVVLGQNLSGIFPEYNADLISGLLGLLFLGLAFGALKLYNIMMERKKGFRPQVLRVE